MNSLHDSSFDFVPSRAWDPIRNFDEIWHTLENEENAEGDAVVSGVWLECDGEMVGIESVRVASVQDVGLGSELVRFTCPRCNCRHESLLFK